jgi:hypothetical protein
MTQCALPNSVRTSDTGCYETHKIKKSKINWGMEGQREPDNNRLNGNGRNFILTVLTKLIFFKTVLP